MAAGQEAVLPSHRFQRAGEDLAAARSYRWTFVLEAGRGEVQNRCCVDPEEVQVAARSRYRDAQEAGRAEAWRSRCRRDDLEADLEEELQSRCLNVPEAVLEAVRILYPDDDPVEVLKVPSIRCDCEMAVELHRAVRTHSPGGLGAAREAEEHNHCRCGVPVVVPEEERGSRYRYVELEVVRMEEHIRCRDFRAVAALEEERIGCRDAPVEVPEEEGDNRYHFEDPVAAQTAAHTALNSAAVDDDLGVDLEVVHSCCSRSDSVLSAQWSEVLSLRRSLASFSRRSRCGGGLGCHPPSRLCRRNTWLLISEMSNCEGNETWDAEIT